MAVDVAVQSLGPIPLGRYEVLSRDLTLNGVGDPPRFIWIVRGQNGQYFVESSEVDGYWIKEDELTRALANGWFRLHE